jgi:hypothetical protein
MMIKQEGRNKVEGITGNRRTRRTTPTRRNGKKMKTGRRHLPRKEKLTKRKSRNVPGVGANTTWRGVTTRKSSADSATSTPTSKPAASTKLQLKPPWQPFSTPSDKPSWPTWPQHGQRLTGQTRMETMGDVLVSFHCRGKLKQGTSNHDLPFHYTVPNHPVLAPHQVGGNLS